MPSPPTYIDLFAGCGGLSLGMHQAGWKSLFAVEKDPSAFATLKYNLIDKKNHFDWPSWLPVAPCNINDLLKTNKDHLLSLQGQVDLVVGGPPCQGFSSAGRRIESDERNQLIFSYLDFVEIVQPKAILFENVRGFTTKFQSDCGTTVPYSQIVINRLIELGYADARGEMIDMSTYGVPQTRKRFILIATRTNNADYLFDNIEAERDSFLNIKNISHSNSVSDALSNLVKNNGVVPCPDTKGYSSGIISLPTHNLQKHLHHLYKGTPDSHRFVKHTEAVEEVFSKLLAYAPKNKKIYANKEGSYGLKKRSVTVLSPDLPSPTITTIPDDFVHYAEPRVMTVRECARLQTFPDWYEFKGPYTTGGPRRTKETPRYTQVGNAVPPLFAELVGSATKGIFADE